MLIHSFVRINNTHTSRVKMVIKIYKIRIKKMHNQPMSIKKTNGLNNSQNGGKTSLQFAINTYDK